MPLTAAVTENTGVPELVLYALINWALDVIKIPLSGVTIKPSVPIFQFPET